MKVIYEPHPVSAERKAELVAQGYKIVDAKFKPADAEDLAPKTKKPAAKRTRAKKAD